MGMRSRVALGAVIIVLLGGASAAGWAYVNKNSSPFSKTIRQTASFPLYYPQHIPIDKKSIQLTNSTNLLSYSLHYQGNIMYVTVQPIPEGFDFNSFNKQIIGSSQFLTGAGTATVGKFSGKMIGSLVTINSWVFVSTTLNARAADVSNLLRQFTAAPTP